MPDTAFRGTLLDSGVPQERELKFSVLDPRVPAMDELAAALAPLQVAAAPEQAILDRYYEDDAGSLHGAGLALRRRRVGERAWATLKGRGVRQGAFHQREELELPLTSAAEAAPWPEAVTERLAGIADPAALTPRVELETARVPFVIRKQGADVAVLSFDAVTARAPGGERSALFDEVEIEALSEATSQADLEGIGEAVDGLVHLTPNPISKLERAEALLLLASW
ncbi:MAG TPA: CYTH domain-containing protein [Trueperaceae bacterium]|nr:CYTH domain-containing protein [Trueperaceae bacterium]